jgi:hypothetical protein
LDEDLECKKGDKSKAVGEAEVRNGHEIDRDRPLRASGIEIAGTRFII